MSFREKLSKIKIDSDLSTKEIDVKDLPSKGICYDVKKIVISPLTVKEESLIAESQNEKSFEVNLNKVLNNVVKNLCPQELTIGDRDYILLWLRSNSYGTNYKINFPCPECGHKNNGYNIDLTKIEINYLSDEYEHPFKLTEPIDITLKILQVKDYNNINRDNNYSELLKTYASIIQSDNSFIDKCYKISKMSVKELAIIKAFIEEFNHGINLNYTVTCSNCNEEVVIPIPFRPSFILPDGKSTINIE